MWIAVIAVVLVALGAVVAKLTWRPSSDETHSVRDYRTAMGTMEHLSDPANRPLKRYSRLTEGSDQTSTSEGAVDWEESPSVHITRSGGARSVPLVPERVGVESFASADELVFDDVPSDRRSAGASGKYLVPEFRSDRARRHALHDMDRRQWHWMAPTVVAVVLVAFGTLAYVGSRRVSHHSTSNVSVTTVSRSGSTSTHGGSTKSTKPAKPAPTTTTIPPSTLVATSVTANSATYAVGSNPYDLVVTAVGTCWVDAISVSTGATVWTGTLQPGMSHVILATGAIRVVLGASATMTANNIPVAFPTPFKAPFTAIFQPPPAPPA